MSIMPQQYSPRLHRPDPNNTNSEMINKLDCLQNINKQETTSKQQNGCCIDKNTTQSIVENIYFQIFITIFTVFSLFMEDIRIIFIDISADTIIDGLNITFICIFMGQILMSLSVPGYLYSFFFFLDIISTISIAMDITMLTNLLYSANSLGTGAQLSIIIRNSKASRAAARTVRVMKIFRLARIVKLYKSATKAKEIKSKRMKQEMNERLKSLKMRKANYVQDEIQEYPSFNEIVSQQQNQNQNDANDPKIVSKVLTFRIMQQKKSERKEEQSRKSIQRKVKKEQTPKSTIKQQQNQPETIDRQLQDHSLKVNKTQSKISKLLSDNTMKKIIMVILLLMFSVPALDTDNYYQQTSSWDFLSDFIANVLYKPEIPLAKINELIQRQIQFTIDSEDSNQQLLVFKTPFKQLYSFDSGTLSNFRVNDLTISSSDVDIDKILKVRNTTITHVQDITQTSINIILSCRSFNQLDSWFSIAKIFFICIGIIYLLNVFNENISQLITEPIEKMLQDVKNNGKSDYFLQLASEMNEQNKGGVINNYETTHVHEALTKISRMISQIFGSKGKQSIYKKIFDEGSVTKNFLSNNRKGYYILGLCSIDNYYKISQILEEEIIALNREVSEYLHSAVFRYGGNAVTNYEGSFLVAFQCPPQRQNLVKNNIDYDQIKSYKSKHLLMKTIKNLIKIQKPRARTSDSQRNNFRKSKIGLLEEQKTQNYLNVLADFSVFSMVKTLVKINKEAKFYKYRKNSKLVQALGQNFQIKINCTLHAGWVKEGFLGSSFKIDYFCYGKPVQQLRRISHYCRNVSNNLIITSQVYELLTTQMKRYTRIIDRYSNKQNQIQQCLYLMDLNLQNISPPKSILDKKGKDDIGSVNMKRILNIEWLKEEQKIRKFRASIFMNNKKELREVMKNVISQEFRRKYLLAYENYTCGQFSQSKQILDQLMTFNKDDHLVQRLNNIIDLKGKTQYYEAQSHKDQQTECLYW